MTAEQIAAIHKILDQHDMLIETNLRILDALFPPMYEVVEAGDAGQIH